MQNYLQKKKLKSKLAKAAALVVLALLAAVWLVARNAPKNPKEYNSYTGEKYAATLFEKVGTEYAQPHNSGNETDDKMNNSEFENAKFGSSSPDLEKNVIQSCSRVEVLMPDGSVKDLNLEDYVAGCVLGEMPLDFEVQALMAQSIAIRTFAVRQKLCGTSKHKNADVCTNSACCQSYADAKAINLSSEKTKKLTDAVNATSGIIMVYDGSPIEAVYHASSGDCTLNSEDVWGGKREYLRSVPSPEGEAEMTSVVYGHRVGMSQHGANILAKNGCGYARILKYYYSGINFGLVS